MINKQQLAKLLFINIILATLYFLAGAAILEISRNYGQVTSVIFIPEGIALAFAIIFGPWVAFGVFVGQLILSIQYSSSLFSGSMTALGNAFEIALGGYLFHKFKIAIVLKNPKTLFKFVGLVTLILQPISATIGVLSLFLVSCISFEGYGFLSEFWLATNATAPLNHWMDIPNAWLNWWMGNSIAQIAVVPIFLAWAYAPDSEKKLNPIDYSIILVGLLVATFLVTSQLEQTIALLIAISYPAIIYIGARFGIRILTMANMSAAILIIYIAISDTGIMYQFSLESRIYYSGAIIMAFILTSLYIYSLMAERDSLQQDLVILATKDGLTQVNNRAHFGKLAKQQLDADPDGKRNMSVALIDLDRFKSVNDTHGHAAGDLVLQEFTKAGQLYLDEKDICGRLGGEEFVALFVDKTAEQAKAMIEKMQVHLKENPILLPSGEEIITKFSAGVVERCSNEELKELLTKADESMYQAKQTGRDKVVIYQW